jgi:hypothetical protein
MILGPLVPFAVLVGLLPGDKNSPWTIGLVLVIAILASSWISFLYRYARRFVQVRPLETGEHAAFPLSEHEQAE